MPTMGMFLNEPTGSTTMDTNASMETEQMGDGMVVRQDQVMTVDEVARYFRVEPDEVREWLREGELHGTDLARGSGWAIRVGDVESFITAHRVGPGGPPSDFDDDGDPDEGDAQESAAVEPEPRT